MSRLRLPLLLVVAVLAVLPAAASAAPLVLVGQFGSGGDGTPDLVPMDVATGGFGTPIPVGGEVEDVVVSSDGSTAYALIDVGGVVHLKFVDLATSQVVGDSVVLPEFALQMALDVTGATLYVSDDGNDQVLPVDIASRAVGTPIPVGDSPDAIVMDPRGGRLYTANHNGSSDSLSAVDLTAAPPAVTPITSPDLDRAEVLTITPDGRRLFAHSFGASANGTTVVPVDTDAKAALPAITAGVTMTGGAVSPDGSRLYAASRDEAQIKVIDVAAGAVVDTIQMPLTDELTQMVVTPDGTRLVVTSRTSNRVTVVDLATKASTPSPLDLPNEIAIAPARTPATPTFTIGQSSMPGAPVSFFAAPTMNAASFSWAFGDGATASGPETQHAYARSGTFDVTLTAANDCAPNAVAAAGGNVHNGTNALCAGPRTASSTQAVTFEAASFDLLIRTKKATFTRKGRLKVKVRCLGPAGGECEGLLRLRRKGKTVAATKYVLPVNSARRFPLRLKRKLRSRDRLKVKAVATVVQGDGTTTRVKRTLRLTRKRS